MNPIIITYDKNKIYFSFILWPIKEVSKEEIGNRDKGGEARGFFK